MRQRPEGAQVVEEHLFRFVASLEIKKALRLQYPVTIMTILSSSVESAEPLARLVGAAIRSSDLVCLMPSMSGVRLLLIDVGLEEVAPVIGRLNQELSDLAPVGFGSASFPTTGSSLEELLTQAETQARAQLSN